ncbi:prephenate dehydratase [Marinomonas sp. SBI22]|uniref:prephenate dehydrogenase/arogenate dehydrogenase family protein n=1 Tax=unclassified Marinomonas TaxID=196814 RepID=UPI0007AF4375|nr:MULTISPECIES: prephenate dehydrogenase/arogenate dehydrogenase family protein [unclassified Marinomonas]KZM41653.1 prephenate dehydratase [Marinomonas sp. SBI22]KZM43489.1 prephenate dehydratase [Marinomonas sp. SBI8L]
MFTLSELQSNQFEKADEHFGNVLIVGLGMIGGSVAKALKERGLAYLFGSDRRHDELTLGVATHVIDFEAELDAEFIEKMDVILLATPVRAMEVVLEQIKPFLLDTTLVTDVGSTKGSVVEAARKVFGSVPANFIPGHPIAGAEKSGVLAANPNLFENHKVIVTPLPNSDALLVDKLHRMWTAIGADVVSMDVTHHDHVLAGSSHLPHLLAYTLVDALANSERSQDVFRFAAGGFRDFTRIASSDPIMWRDVFLANKDATLESLDSFTEHLQQLRHSIEVGDGPAMFGVFTRAKSARDHFLRLLEARSSSSASTVKPISIKVLPASLVKGEINVRGDKFLSHSLITMAALSEGVSEFSNLDMGQGVKVTLQALRDMGVVVEDFGGQRIRIHGVGLNGLKAPIAPINVHESELSLHVLLPVLAAQKFAVTFVAEGALSSQPFVDLLSIVKVMGASVTTSESGCLPFTIATENQLINQYKIDVKGRSRQLKLAALIAGVMSQKNVELNLPRDLDGSDAVLSLFSCEQDVRTNDKGDNILAVKQGQKPQAASLDVPADDNKTAWLTLLACLSPGSKLMINNAGITQMNSAFLKVLLANGANIELHNVNEDQPLTVSEGKIKVGFAAFSGFTIKESEILSVCSELLLLCVAAVYAKGTSRIEGIHSLPYRWEDRVTTFVDALTIIGVPCSLQAGVLEIEGCIPCGGELDSAGDYHLSLAMLALGMRSRSPVTVNDCHKLLEEFEEFETIVESLGFHCQLTQ